jgi:hypothetical protein
LEKLPLPEHHAGLELHHHPKKGFRKEILVAMLLFLAGSYLAIDSGKTGLSINLPVHVFKQATPADAAVSSLPTATAQAAQPSPDSAASTTQSADTKKYSLANTPLSFDYPTAWGDPAVTTDEGFTVRGGTNKTNGAHAYVVSFANNADVQLAITAYKYLPPTRSTAEYYDYLQVCVGTHDTKFYKQTLMFSSNAGLDTPSTVTCSVGPLADATKIDDSTIIQSKAKDDAGKLLGDVYTRNLSSKDFPVVRIKDAASSHGTEIKAILSTIKVSADSTTP